MTVPVCICADCIRCGCNQWDRHHASADQVARVPNFLKPRPGARCYTCRERPQDCQCPGGPDID